MKLHFLNNHFYILNSQLIQLHILGQLLTHIKQQSVSRECQTGSFTPVQFKSNLRGIYIVKFKPYRIMWKTGATILELYRNPNKSPLSKH